ncbi:PemK-like protein [Paenibacillus caui]|uniref:PemK-like protein n=1 Tax=Paenibacillus caui TaxID=2873927 RepID=UPI001F3BC151|nr:PemK-like protein [Paenibacillus caui]
MEGLKYSDYDQWSEISKQYIFEAWVPFVPDRPLDFFVHNEGSVTEGFITSVIDDRTVYSIHKAVIPLKRRKVVILTADSLCKDKYYPDILVAKIVSIKDHHRDQEWYKLLVQDKHALFVHLPAEITGEESYINMAQVTSIGKKLLIEKKNILSAGRMQLVERRHKECIDLGVIKTEIEEAINE